MPAGPRDLPWLVVSPSQDLQAPRGDPRLFCLRHALHSNLSKELNVSPFYWDFTYTDELPSKHGAEVDFAVTDADAPAPPHFKFVRERGGDLDDATRVF